VTTDILILFVLGTIGYMSPELMLAGYTGSDDNVDHHDKYQSSPSS